MIVPGDKVLVAFSGGPDSTALLHILLELQGVLDCELCAAHLNHRLRGQEADEDEQWCSETAASLGVEFHSARVDVAAEAERTGGNLEEAAREVRYRFLEKTAERTAASKIAVGHSRSDQAETVLLRFVRGAGLRGLRGMSPVRGKIIRPLIDADRDSILAYLKEKNLGFRTDASNRDERFSRVLLRRKVIPLLRRLNPSLDGTIASAAEIIAGEDDFLSELSESILQEISHRDGETVFVRLADFRSLHPALQRRALRRLVLRAKGSLRAISRALIVAMRRCAVEGGPAVEIDGRWTVKAAGEHLVLEPKTSDCVPDFSYNVRVGERLRVKEVDKSYKLGIIETGNGVDIKALSGPKQAFLDADLAGESLEVRSRRPGDRYRPLGAPGKQKLQDMFVNAKIGRADRARSPVFVSRDRICWVRGLRICEDFRVTLKTTRILSIEEVD